MEMNLSLFHILNAQFLHCLTVLPLLYLSMEICGIRCPLNFGIYQKPNYWNESQKVSSCSTIYCV